MATQGVLLGKSSSSFLNSWASTTKTTYTKLNEHTDDRYVPIQYKYIKRERESLRNHYSPLYSICWRNAMRSFTISHSSDSVETEYVYMPFTIQHTISSVQVATVAVIVPTCINNMLVHSEYSSSFLQSLTLYSHNTQVPHYRRSEIEKCCSENFGCKSGRCFFFFS